MLILITPRNAYTNINSVMRLSIKTILSCPNDAPLKFSDSIRKADCKIKAFRKTIASFNLKIPDISIKGYVLGSFLYKEKRERTLGENKGQSSISNKFSYTLGVKLSEREAKCGPPLSFTCKVPEFILINPALNAMLNNMQLLKLNFDINIYKIIKILHTEEKSQWLPNYYYNIHTASKTKELKPRNTAIVVMRLKEKVFLLAVNIL